MNELKSIQDTTEYKGIKDKEKNLVLQINTKKKNDLVFLASTETQKGKKFFENLIEISKR